MLTFKFKDIEYNLNTIKNISVSLKDYYNEIKNNFILVDYQIIGNLSPELVAQNLYGSTSYEWAVLLVNDIVDPFNDWVKPDEIVRLQAELKYANVVDGINGIHHIKDPVTDEVYYDLVEYPAESGYWYHSGDTNHSNLQVSGNFNIVTNIDFELEENEKKRTIKIILPTNISTFESAIIDILNARNN